MNKIDFSYASKSEHNFAQRLLIKTIESRIKIEVLYEKGKDFFTSIKQKLETKFMDDEEKKEMRESLEYERTKYIYFSRFYFL